jgi:hypothetical protein
MEHWEDEDPDTLERKDMLILVNEIHGRNYGLDEII